MEFIKTVRLIFLMAFLFAYVPKANAQSGTDKVIMLSSETKEGKVTADNGTAIKFVYKGETLEYEIKKAEINKIVFASGRVELVNDAIATAKAAISAPGDRKNKIAVLPVDYSTNEGNATVESMRLRIQTETINSIKQNTATVQVQDPMTTNALLNKNNIQFDQLRSITPQEMATLLGVEYVVYTSINVTNKGTYSYGSGVTSTDGKKTTTYDANKDKTKTSGTTVTSNSASTTVEYDTRVDFSMYNDQGTSLYSESRKAFGSGIDAYTASLNYLIKRCPFGSKAKH
jgi:hypothetical protein